MIYGTDGHINTEQDYQLWLDDYGIITKQDILNIFVKEIYDDRDGVILNHINNAYVVITDGGTVIQEIDKAGIFNISISVTDSDGNTGNTVWYNTVTDTGISSFDIAVKNDNPPVVMLHDNHVLKLSDHSFTITRDNLITEVVNLIIDERESVITPDITDVRIFQTSEYSTSGSVPEYATTSGLLFEDITEFEVLNITEVGGYRMLLNASDSRGGLTAADFNFDVIN